jgi:hypothetical protein
MQFVGPNIAPVTVGAQSAIEVAVSTVPGWNYGQMTQVEAYLNVQLSYLFGIKVAAGCCGLCWPAAAAADRQMYATHSVLMPLLQLTRTADSSAATATFSATTAAGNGTVSPQVRAHCAWPAHLSGALQFDAS